MIRSILVPTDFSANAMKAALYAASIAEKSGAMIYLLHVIEPVAGNINEFYLLDEKYIEDITSDRINAMNTFQQELAAAHPAIKTATEIAKGMTIASIIDFTEVQQIDLIVPGTKGATGLKEIFAGSVTSGMIGCTKTPVLAVPNEYSAKEPGDILFATNHFEKNKELLARMIEVARLYSARIHVAVFVDTDHADVADYIYNTRELTYYLDFLKKTYPDIAFKGELLEGSDFEETIERYDTKNEVEMIAMITYPKNFWERLMRKSATKKMALHSRIPVLAIPA
jgi:nucleotide-binding universal stress UspA family protein